MESVSGDIRRRLADSADTGIAEPERLPGMTAGIARVGSGFYAGALSSGERLSLVLYHRNEEEPFLKIPFPAEYRIGDSWSMYVDDVFPEDTEYTFEDEKGVFPDPYGIAFSGRDAYGKTSQYGNPKRSPLYVPDFDWQGDRPLRLPFEELVIYRLNVRGFTMSPSSKVTHRGTFDGVTEKLPYLKELGVTAIELMPCQEFEELMVPDGNPFRKGEPDGRVNLWGYAPAYRFAPKAGYCRKKERNPVNEFRTLVRSFHRAGIEVIVELWFGGGESVSYVLDVLRHWVTFYHADGIRISGNVPIREIAADPLLTETKLFYGSFEGVPRGRVRHLGEYNDGFQNDMRRFLKGDEGMLNSLVWHSLHIPDCGGTVNYMANTNGFTMADLVSYDRKHNEANGENNADGTDANWSWNCGAEGPTKKKKILDTRRQQVKNAFFLLFLSQGTPLILAGDEFGQTQHGNNNAYCQDGPLAWIDWAKLKKNSELFSFVKKLIAFRKAHPVFRCPVQPSTLDTRSIGQPDVSFHGVAPWQPKLENFRRQLGILYCGAYAKKADGTDDDSFYVLYNMHWESHEFALPNPERGSAWYILADSSDQGCSGFLPEGEERRALPERHFVVPARTVIIMTAKKEPENDKKGPKRTRKQDPEKDLKQDLKQDPEKKQKQDLKQDPNKEKN